MRCAIYSRVSTTSNQHTSNQIIKLKEIAIQKDLEIVSEYSDVMSGTKGRQDRKGFDSLIKGATRKQFDIILVWSVDRLGRSLQDLISFLNEIESVGCDLYIHQSGISTDTPTGKMLFSLIGLISEFEVGIIRERILLGQERARKNGVKFGRPSNFTKGTGTAVKVLREKGMSIKKIAKELSIGTQTVYKVLEAV